MAFVIVFSDAQIAINLSFLHTRRSAPCDYITQVAVMWHNCCHKSICEFTFWYGMRRWWQCKWSLFQPCFLLKQMTASTVFLAIKIIITTTIICRSAIVTWHHCHEFIVVEIARVNIEIGNECNWLHLFSHTRDDDNIVISHEILNGTIAWRCQSTVQQYSWTNEWTDVHFWKENFCVFLCADIEWPVPSLLVSQTIIVIGTKW